jgi:hypothetical protein
MKHLILIVALLLSTKAFAVTYCVNPATGNNANSGTQVGGVCTDGNAWLNPPGTQNATATAYWSGQWGSKTPNTGDANKIQCGDVILLKGGTSAGVSNTQTLAQGGAWCLAKMAGTLGCAARGGGTYYVTPCPLNNPITIRVASNAEWAGSNGHFTINGTGITSTDTSSYPGNQFAIIYISGLAGMQVRGISASQRIRVINSDNVAFEITSGQDYNVAQGNNVIQWWEAVGSQRNGMVMGDITDVWIDNGISTNNREFGLNCGIGLHHECANVGWTNIEVSGSGQGGGVFSCEAVVFQGGSSVRAFNLYVHDNQCNGWNSGSGDHVYPVRSRAIVRDSVFSRNGLLTPNNGNTAATNMEGSGDGAPSELNAPGQGWCTNGAMTVSSGICSTNTDCPSIAPQCTIFDAYTMFQRVLTYGGGLKNQYAHHGSGFTWWWNITNLVPNITNGNGGNVFTDHVAADHMLVNSIIVQRAGTPGLNYNTNGLFAVCRQGTPNQGQPCTNNAQCGGATTSTPACSQYLPMMAMRNTLWRPSFGGSNNEVLTNLSFTCDASCSGGSVPAGGQCASDAECGNCVGGCNFNGSVAATFTNALAGGAKFLTNASNKIGAAFDPAFVSTPANCLDGSNVANCNVALTAGSVAIDAGTYMMLTTAFGSSTNIVPVKANIVPRGLNYNGNNDDPTSYFIPQNGFPYYGGDTIQIQNATCDAGNPALAAGRAIVLAVSRVPAQITLDRNCTWAAANLGVSLPWEGGAPDLGAYEFNGFGPPSTTSTSTIPVPTTTSTSVTTTTNPPGCGTPASDNFNRLGGDVAPSLNWTLMTDWQSFTMLSPVIISNSVQAAALNDIEAVRFTGVNPQSNSAYACLQLTNLGGGAGSSGTGQAYVCLIDSTSTPTKGVCCFATEGNGQTSWRLDYEDGTVGGSICSGTQDWLDGDYIGIQRTSSTTYRCFRSPNGTSWTALGTTDCAAPGRLGTQNLGGFGFYHYAGTPLIVDNFEAGDGNPMSGIWSGGPCGSNAPSCPTTTSSTSTSTSTTVTTSTSTSSTTSTSTSTTLGPGQTTSTSTSSTSTTSTSTSTTTIPSGLRRSWKGGRFNRGLRKGL